MKIILIISSLLFISFPSFSSSFTTLKKTLSSLESNNEIHALVESSYTEKRGKKKQVKTKNGLIQVKLSDDAEGIKLIYASETLNQLELETSLKQMDENAETPTLNAINGVGISEMRNMLSAAPGLLRMLNKATFINDENIEVDGKVLTQLNLTLPLEAIIQNKEVHEYVDDFICTYSILINEAGIPIKTTTSFTGSGSAYIFFSMEITRSTQSNFLLIDNRLVNIKKSFENKQSSTWGDTESKGYKTLTLL